MFTVIVCLCVFVICCKQRKLLLLFVFRLAVDPFFSFFTVIYAENKKIWEDDFKKNFIL
jgi:hypothetical protein